MIHKYELRARTALELLEKQALLPLSREMTKKVFKPKHSFPKLKDYGRLPSESIWDQVPRINWEDVPPIGTGIDADMLKALGLKYECEDTVTLEKVYKDLTEGARLGVSEESRIQSTSSNAPSSFDHGEEVTDALIDWLHKGFAIGSFDKNELPFKKTRISGLMCKMKPNNTARIIVNLSRGRPKSVNEGINKDNFPTAMSNTTEWIRIMWRCGMNCRFTKHDWASAYKGLSIYYVSYTPPPLTDTHLVKNEKCDMVLL